MITIICTNFGNSTIYISQGRQSERKTGIQKNLGTSGQKFSYEFLPYKWSLPCIEYRVKKYPLSIQDGRQKSKMAATKFSFIDISTSHRGDFPRIIEIALFLYIIELKIIILELS